MAIVEGAHGRILEAFMLDFWGANAVLPGQEIAG